MLYQRTSFMYCRFDATSLAPKDRAFSSCDLAAIRLPRCKSDSNPAPPIFRARSIRAYTRALFFAGQGKTKTRRSKKRKTSAKNGARSALLQKHPRAQACERPPRQKAAPRNRRRNTARPESHFSILFGPMPLPDRRSLEQLQPTTRRPTQPNRKCPFRHLCVARPTTPFPPDRRSECR